MGIGGLEQGSSQIELNVAACQRSSYCNRRVAVLCITLAALRLCNRRTQSQPPTTKLTQRTTIPHPHTTTMASGYGLAGGTYTHIFPRATHVIWRRRRHGGDDNGTLKIDPAMNATRRLTTSTTLSKRKHPLPSRSNLYIHQ